MIRWAVRKRVGAVYLVAIFWIPTVTLAAIIWALAAIREKPSDLWPVLGVTLLVAKKAMALLYYLTIQGERSVKALRHYRRHFHCHNSN